ncbi:MAG: hypothetical protein LBH15_04515 [Treponema sp.]|jgi:hypothetical protein|nr:hypothetical protein [Treponema sp.]
MKKALVIAIPALLLFSCFNLFSGGAQGKNRNSIPAAEYLGSRVAELDRVLYVYRDFYDGMNNFTQKAWVGDSDSDIPEMDEAAQAHSGISGIRAGLDLSRHSWGGYMFVNGVLAPGGQDPQADFGNTDAGLDLTGASKLVFYAKGESGGERVEFFMGGLGWNEGTAEAPYADSSPKTTGGYKTLSKDWLKFEIPLKGRDLSRIGCGFGWVTNNTNNQGKQRVNFFLDDIRYEFDEKRTGPVFLQSYASAAPGTDDAIINNFAYLYDNAAAAMALSYAGKHEQARRIADAIVYAADHDRSYSDGRLRNAYSAGDPRSFTGWRSASDAEFARLPGFWDSGDKAWYEDFYAVSTSTGNCAWAIMALCEVYRCAGPPAGGKYLEAAKKIGDFVLALEDAGTGNRGFKGGYEGWEGSETRVTYKSTEHNIDLVSAFDSLYRLSNEGKYRDASESAGDFVLSMYDAERHCFYTGTGDDGVTANRDVLPLDCNTWAILALGDSFTEGAELMEFVEREMGAFGGYDFNNDRDGVWFEGTAQAALAYKQIGNTEKYNAILGFLNSHVTPGGGITAADRDGVSTGFLVSGTDIPWNYGKREHLGATAWLAFAQMGRNPFSPIGIEGQ